MHTVGLKPTERPSTTTSLEQRYNSAPSLPSGAGDAKKAGKPSLTSTDYVAAGDGEFKTLQGPAGLRNDKRSVQVKTWNAHGGADFLPTSKYAPSGRL